MRQLFQLVKISMIVTLLLIPTFNYGINQTENTQPKSSLVKLLNTNQSKFVNDTCILGDCISGVGVLVKSNQQKFVGQFKNGKLDGYGIIHYNSGSIFVGQFQNGYRHGQGSLKHATKIVNGIWTKDKYTKGIKEDIRGCKSGNCYNGYGVYIYENSTIFIGQFSEGRAEGEGICFFSDGDVYFGDWKNHGFNGYGTYMYTENMTLQAGFWNEGNYTEAEVVNEAAIVQTEIEDKSDAADSESEIYAVVVGAAQYRHMQALRYTDDDAYSMTAFLRSPEGGAVKKSNIKVLIDEAATKSNILNALKTFADKADENDVFLFYFSGHGLPESLLPIDYEGKGSTKQLFHRDLVEIFKQSKAKSKVVIADACHSGSMTSFKGETYEASINTYYSEIRKNKGGLVMLMSSKAEETSIENNGLRQGIFSHFLLRGLYGAANTDNDNLIRLDELFEYVQRNVSFYTNDYQTPVIYGDNSFDLPIAIIRE